MQADRFALGAARALPPIAILGAGLALIAAEGGYSQRDWLPVAIGAAGALTVCLTAGWRLPASRLARLSLGLLAGFVAWNFLSIAWAGTGGGAWDTANRWLFYLLAATVLVLYPWSPESARRLLLAWCVGLTAVLIVSVVFAAGADDPRDVMINGRFSYPIGYAGGSAAMAALGICPTLLLSARPETPAVLRPLLMAAAAFMLEYALLPQSRGALIGVAAGLALLVGLSPDRLALVARIVIVGAAALLTLGPVLDAYAPFDERAVDPSALDDAWRAMGFAALLAALGGVVAQIAERRIPPRRSVAIRVPRRLAVLVMAALLLGLVGVVAANGAGVRDSASERWNEFRSGEGVAASGPSRFTATGDPTRYDYWRVALDAFADHPLAGVGAGNYEPRYAARRDHPKYSRYAHSLPLNVLAETGVVGFLLLFGAIGCAVAAVLSRRSGLSASGRATVAGCLAVTASLLGHASVDWVEQVPAVAIPGLGFLFVGVRLAAPERAPGSRTWPFQAAAAVLVVVAALSLTLAYLSLRYVERAAGLWTTAPARAYDDLERAQALNPLSTGARLQEALLAIELRDYCRARSALRDAVDISDSWYAHFELALVEAHQGRLAAARAQIERASELNGREPFVRRTRAAILRGVSPDPRRTNRALRRATSAQFR